MDFIKLFFLQKKKKGEDEAAVLESNLNDSGFEEENKEDVYVQHFGKTFFR